ncbi:MAG: hypothetical protein JSS23_00070 [Proteobacteria bacterium]|nr:hypothetical protein [Pseudomonadota bacterium]
MTTPTNAQLQAQLRSITGNGLLALLITAASLHHLPVAFVVAIASRETNCVNMLGDYQHTGPGGALEAHGVGIMQRDIQHADARAARDDGSWRTHPEVMIEADCLELAQALAAVKARFPNLSASDQLQVTADAYNSGQHNAFIGELAGNPDGRTTGHDYGADVMRRMAVFQSLGQWT